MAERTQTGDGLHELFADALVEGELETDLLVRYAREAESLEAGERERVEAYLAASPAHRDRLRVLTRFALSQGAALETETAAAERSAVVVPISSHPRWRTRVTVVATALAAGLAVALLYRIPTSGPGPGSSPLQVAEEAIGSGQELARALPQDEALAEIPEAPSAPPVTQIADADPAIEVVPEAPLPEETGEAVVPEPAAVLVASSPPPVEEPLASARVAPEAEVEAAIEEIPLGEPLLVAMNFSDPLLYTPPSGSAALDYLGGVRGSTSDLPMPQALVPPHVARTLGGSPTLYWFSSTPTDARVEFVLADRVSVDPVLELTLESPVPAGIHAVRLRDHGVVLERGREYRWFVSVSPTEGEPSADLVTRGGIQRMLPGAELEAKLEAAEPGAMGRVYAESGLWYDALASVSEAIEYAPQEARLRELRAGLFEQVGLREAADYDRRALPPSSTP